MNYEFWIAFAAIIISIFSLFFNTWISSKRIKREKEYSAKLELYYNLLSCISESTSKDKDMKEATRIKFISTKQKALLLCSKEMIDKIEIIRQFNFTEINPNRQVEWAAFKDLLHMMRKDLNIDSDKLDNKKIEALIGGDNYGA